MSVKYPRIADTHSISPSGVCISCKKPQADYAIVLEVNKFRGDDSVYKVHKKCIAGLRYHDLLSVIKLYWEEINGQK